jgi:hypothetical protein
MGFTSDTSFFNELVPLLENSKIIIANINEINKADIDCKIPKENHLGFFGCFNVLSNLKEKPVYFIMSEFWAGKGDIRIQLAKKLKKDLVIKDKDMNRINILPGDIGLRISLDNMKIICSKCGNEISGKDMTAVTPTDEFGQIRYCCPSCIC